MINYIKNRLKNCTFTSLYLNCMIILMLIIPKENNTLEKYPIRLIIMFIFCIIAFCEYKKGIIKFNSIKTKHLTIIYSLFILCCIPSLFVTKNLIVSIYTIAKFILFYLVFLLSIKIEYSDAERKNFYFSFIVGIVLICIYGICSYAFDIKLFKYSNYMYPGIFGRIRSTFFNPCYYAAFTTIAFIIFLFKYYEKDSKKNYIYLILLILIFTNLLLTFTRSAFIIFISLSLLFFILFHKFIFSRKTIILIVSICLIAISVPGSKNFIKKTARDCTLFLENIKSFLPIFDGDSNDNLEDDNSPFEDSSLNDREIYAKMSKQITKDNLLTGIGFGTYLDYMHDDSFSIKYSEYKSSKVVPHSSILLMFAEVGLFATSLFLIFILIIIIDLFNIFIFSLKRSKKIYNLSCVLLLICFAFYSVAFMSENSMYDTQLFPIFLMIIGFGYSILKSEINKFDKRIIFISSTGGHLTELLMLKDLFKKYDSYIITEKTKSNKNLKEKYKNVNYLVYGTKHHIISYIFKFIFNIFKSLFLYIRIRPDVVITTGTHTAVPMCYIGKLFGSKIIYIETFANIETKTVAGRIVYPIADTFIVQWESMLKLYPKAVYGGWIF